MDTQKERSRMDEDNISDPNTDVTRSERQQRSSDANEGRNAQNQSASGGHGHHGGNETGSHREGQYDKESSKPMTDKEGTGRMDQ
jgi:hypothetical protein